MPNDMHVFEMALGPDTVVARNHADAWAVWSEHCGEPSESYAARDEWVQIDSVKPITIAHDDGPPQPECPHGCMTWATTFPHPTDWTGHHHTCPATHVTKTATEWAATNGRGFLCSTEF